MKGVPNNGVSLEKGPRVVGVSLDLNALLPKAAAGQIVQTVAELLLEEDAQEMHLTMSLRGKTHFTMIRLDEIRRPLKRALHKMALDIVSQCDGYEGAPYKKEAVKSKITSRKS